MIHTDELGRITRIDPDTTAFKGHSVCNKCDKDMEVVWDAICFYCRKTFCYDCIGELLERWVCEDCIYLAMMTEDEEE